MSECIIPCRSLTYAQRFTRSLEQCGLTAHILRTPGRLTNNGCGYAVGMPCEIAQEGKACLNKKGYHPQKFYYLENNEYRELAL